MNSLTTWQLHAATCWLLLAAFCHTGVSADGFQDQFSNQVYYALAIAGISLGSAAGAALLVLLIYCLVRQQRNSDKKLTASDTEASNSTNSRVGGAAGVGGGGGGGATYGAMALPSVAKPAEPVKNGGGRLHAAAGGVDSGGRKRAPDAPSNVHYTNPAFSAANPDSAEVVLSSSGLFRHSSFLKPISYSASLESSKSRDSSRDFVDSGPIIHHPQVRTSPAATLDPRTFLSQDNLGTRQQRQQQQIAGVTDYSSKRMSYAEPPQHQHQKRLSYAEQRAQTGSSVELVSGQVFASSSSPYSTGQLRHDRSLPRQPVAMVRVLPTQQEEEFVARIKRPAPQPPLQEGPSFPKTSSRSASFSKQQQQRQQHQQQLEETPVPRQHQSLHRINLDGGDDGRSVTSTVLKQEALQALEIIDTLE